MKFTAEQIAGILEGVVEGNPQVEVSKLSKIEEGEEGALTFLANPKYTHYIYTTKASIAIVNNTFIPEQDLSCTLIKVEDAYKAFSKLLEYYNQVKLNKSGIEQPSYISDNVKQGDNIYIGAFTYIGNNVTLGNNVKIFPSSYIGDNVTIGDDTVVFSGAKVYSESIIGKNCVINSGAIIGADGFGFAPDENGEYSKVGENCKIGGQVDIVGHITIGNNVKIQAQSGIGRNVKDNEVLQGSPALSYGDFNKSYVYFKNLPKIVKTVNDLEKNNNGNN